MELPGVEPGSKQGTKLLSTCLAFDYLSGISWSKATYLYLSIYVSNWHRSATNSILVTRHFVIGRHEEGASAKCSSIFSLRIGKSTLLSGECVIYVAIYWLKNLFYERILMARHAYNSIRLLSIPFQPLNCFANIQKRF